MFKFVQPLNFTENQRLLIINLKQIPLLLEAELRFCKTTLIFQLKSTCQLGRLTVNFSELRVMIAAFSQIIYCTLNMGDQVEMIEM